MEAGTETRTAEELERELDEALDTETLRAARATSSPRPLITDESIAEKAAADPVGYWEEQAADLDWFEPLGHRARTTRTPRSTSGSRAGS